MHYDVIVVGGGIAGSTVALTSSRAGLRVLILESERAFRDRIRGEGLHAWGVREARKLDIADILYASCARPLPVWETYVGGQRVERRDLRTSSAAACESMGFFHPHMQEVLFGAAESAGAQVRRGARVHRIASGTSPGVGIQLESGATEDASARLIVVATGRTSTLRSMLGLEVKRGSGGMKTTGVLLEGVDVADDAVAMFLPPTFGMASLLFPLPARRARLYFAANPRYCDKAFSGVEAGPELFERCRQMGVPSALLGDARIAGPLATFDGTPTWVEGAWPSGIALVGDAAGTLDPAFGAGLSLALLDARTLSEEIAAHGDLPQAAENYRIRRADHYRKLLLLESCVGRVLYGGFADGEKGPLPFLLPKMRELGLDLLGGGPHGGLDDDTERLLFTAA